MSRTVLHGGRIFDGTGSPIADGDVAFEDGRVVAVGTGLDAVVLGGDKRAIAELRQDARLAPYLDLAVARFLTVPDPKLAVLADSPRLFLAIRIWLTEP